MPRLSRGKLIERTIKAIQFMELHRTWTIEDLSVHLGIHKKNGAEWLRSLSLYLPITEVKPVRYGDGGGKRAALYSLIKNFLEFGEVK